jgi:Zn-finger nucleic acid-binding protein
MDCPVCGERLKEIDRSGVMVDICPSCKGIWLDRGEIDKIIGVEGKGGNVASSSQERGDSRGQERRDSRDHDDHDDNDRDHKDHGDDRTQGQTSGGKKRRPSFLQDILGGLGE